MLFKGCLLACLLVLCENYESSRREINCFYVSISLDGNTGLCAERRDGINKIKITYMIKEDQTWKKTSLSKISFIPKLFSRRFFYEDAQYNLPKLSNDGSLIYWVMAKSNQKQIAITFVDNNTGQQSRTTTRRTTEQTTFPHFDIRDNFFLSTSNQNSGQQLVLRKVTGDQIQVDSRILLGTTPTIAYIRLSRNRENILLSDSNKNVHIYRQRTNDSEWEKISTQNSIEHAQFISNSEIILYDSASYQLSIYDINRDQITYSQLDFDNQKSSIVVSPNNDYVGWVQKTSDPIFTHLHVFSLYLVTELAGEANRTVLPKFRIIEVGKIHSVALNLDATQIVYTRSYGSENSTLTLASIERAIDSVETVYPCYDDNYVQNYPFLCPQVSGVTIFLVVVCSIFLLFLVIIIALLVIKRQKVKECVSLQNQSQRNRGNQ